MNLSTPSSIYLVSVASSTGNRVSRDNSFACRQVGSDFLPNLAGQIHHPGTSTNWIPRTWRSTFRLFLAITNRGQISFSSAFAVITVISVINRSHLTAVVRFLPEGNIGNASRLLLAERVLISAIFQRMFSLYLFASSK